MTTIAELISQIDIKIEASKHVITEANENIERFKLLKESVQAMCTHKHKDGKDAFKQYAHDGHHGFERCAICLKEVTV